MYKQKLSNIYIMSPIIRTFEDLYGNAPNKFYAHAPKDIAIYYQYIGPAKIENETKETLKIIFSFSIKAYSPYLKRIAPYRHFVFVAEKNKIKKYFDYIVWILRWSG